MNVGSMVDIAYKRTSNHTADSNYEIEFSTATKEATDCDTVQHRGLDKTEKKLF